MGGRKGGAGSGPPLRAPASWHHAGQRELSPSAGAARPARALVTDAEQPSSINEHFVAQHTVLTGCTVTIMHREIKRLCPGRIPARISS